MRSDGTAAHGARDGRLLQNDTAWATGVTLIAWCLYAATTRTDVGGPEDSPKFQFIGYVLGTAHAPGYPLYVLLTHAFVQIPVGTLAYRANLFSALMGSITCGVVFQLARQLGAARVSAAAASLAMATGAVFWRYSILAEVYALAAALSAIVMTLLIRWGQRPARWRLYAACGVFALGVGNHLIIVGLLPAAVAYGIWRDRSLLRVGAVATIIAIGLLGISQYAFVILRTRESAPYLEAHAGSVQALGDVLLARDFEHKRLQFGIAALVAERAPLVAGYARRELGSAGTLLVLLGLGLAAKRRRADAALLAAALAGMLLVVLNIEGDIAGFLVPVLALAWPFAALGLDAVRALAAPLGPARTYVFVACALWLPCARFAAAHPQIQNLDHTDDAESFRAVYGALPTNAAIVFENYWTNAVLTYLHVSGEVRPDPSPLFILNSPTAARSALAEGRQVFAFGESAAWLEAIGLAFRPADLPGPALASWLRLLPIGTRVAIAASGRPLPYELAPADARSAALSRPRSFGAMSWVVGRRSFAADQNDSGVALPAAAPRHWWRRGSTSAATITMSADASGARVAFGQEHLEVPEGIVVLTVRPDGTIQRRLSFKRDAPLRVPSLVPVMTFDREVPCETLRAGTSADVSHVLESGGWLATTDRLGTATVDLQFTGARAPALRHRVVQGHGAAAVEDGGQGRTRLVLQRTGWERPVFHVTLGAPSMAVVATLRRGGAVDTLRVCTASPPAIIRPGAESGEVPAGAEGDRYFSAGWHYSERAGSTRFRWAERTATVLVPMRQPATIEFTIGLSPASAEGAVVHATMNERAVGACAVPAGAWTTCRFIAAAVLVREGLNHFTLASTTTVAPGADPGEQRELAFSTKGATLRIVR